MLVHRTSPDQKSTLRAQDDRNETTGEVEEHPCVGEATVREFHVAYGCPMPLAALGHTSPARLAEQRDGRHIVSILHSDHFRFQQVRICAQT